MARVNIIHKQAMNPLELREHLHSQHIDTILDGFLLSWSALPMLYIPGVYTLSLNLYYSNAGKT